MGTVGITLDDGRMLKLSETLCEALKGAEDDGSRWHWSSRNSYSTVSRRSHAPGRPSPACAGNGKRPEAGT